MSRPILSLVICFLHAFLYTNVLSINAYETDINCLKSIKQSLEDPLGNLASWVFKDIDSDNVVCRFKGVECWDTYAVTVTRIELPGMGLKGQFPHGIKHCLSLERLNLSNNELYGSIPADIGFIMPYISNLDLSANNFSGEIPSSLADCSYLDVLKLDNNHLTGRIPKEFSLHSRFRMTKESLENNPGLCGWPLGSCKHHSWAEDSFWKGVEIGYAVSLVAAIVAFLHYDSPSWMNLLIMNTMLKMKMVMRRKIKTKKQIDQRDTKLHTAHNLQQAGREILRLEKMVARFPYIDLRNATNNFHERNMIGIGNMGIVFKARLPSGNFLAVKKLNYQQFLDEQFISEMKTLGTLTHTNLLPLVGFCIESKERLLIYKYMPNGRLYDWLNPIKSKSKVMHWAVRVKIAVGLARGLAWLHQGGHIRVIHLNVSSKSILLDHDFEPRLSNFGEAMIITPSSNSCLNPEFWEMAFVKEDVYSFGVVLLELITGEDSTRMSSDGSENEWISHLLDRNSSTFRDIIDISIMEQEIQDEMSQFLEIAFNCVKSIPDRRPTMQQVYQQITTVGERYGLFDVSKLLRKTETSIHDHKGKSVVDIEIVET